MQIFTQRAIAIIQAIPHGKVMTYGQIARIAGSPRGARQVVRILHSLSKRHRLPWHRVINAKGQIARKDTEQFLSQKQFLQNEGIDLKDDCSIDLEQYQYHPEE
jgi:methylated-DNA-protein-cysteine methyltransferase-like protein